MYNFFEIEAARMNESVVTEAKDLLEHPELLAEGMFRDRKIRIASGEGYGDLVIDMRNIEALHDALIEIKDQIRAVEYLMSGYATGRTKHTDKKFYLSTNKTRFDSDQLNRRLKWLNDNYNKIEAAYKNLGGDQTYYQALAAQAQQDIARNQRLDMVMKLTDAY